MIEGKSLTATMKQALEALNDIHPDNMTPMAEEYWNKAITSLRQAIKELERQEPVDYEKLAALGWQAIECGICGGGAMGYPQRTDQEPDWKDGVMEQQAETILWQAKRIAELESQEPVDLKRIDEQDCLLDVDEKAWRSLVENRGGCRCHISPPCGACSDPISEEEMNEVGYTYTHPPQRTWVWLTDEEIDTWNIVGHESLREFIRAIEAKLKEKNT